MYKLLFITEVFHTVAIIAIWIISTVIGLGKFFLALSDFLGSKFIFHKTSQHT